MCSPTGPAPPSPAKPTRATPSKRQRAAKGGASGPPLTSGQKIADTVAATMGSWRFIIIQSIILLLWIILNVTAFIQQWDPYPFILLNLGFSTQAAYAAPLILLAQNRQDDRDRVNLDADRESSRQFKADVEYLAREIAAIRMALGEVATRDFLRAELSRYEDQRERDTDPARFD